MTVAFQEGQATPVLGGTYAGVQDVMLLVNGGPGGGGNSANENFGARGELNVGSLGFPGDPYFRRDLIKFDVSALTGQVASVNSMTLRFYVSNTGAGSGNIQLFQVAAANGNWVEGTGVATGNNGTGFSTWDSKIQGSAAWAGGAYGMGVAGTDYLSSALSSYSYVSSSLSANQAVDFVFNDTSFLQDWISGNNPGLFLRQANESTAQNWVSLYSSEAGINFPTQTASISLRPQLIIDFNAVPEPSRVMLLGVAMSVVLSRRRRCSCGQI